MDRRNTGRTDTYYTKNQVRLKNTGIILIYKFITGKVGCGYYKKGRWQIFIDGDYMNIIGCFYRGVEFS